jgi:hypothetical protein
MPLRPAAGLFLLAVAACAGQGASPPAPQPEPEPEGEDLKVVASIVNATAIVGKCPDDKRMNAKAAQLAIQRLVGPCATVPGGKAHFSATLYPGGRIELASPEGNPAGGVVPTCVLQNRLHHKVLLRSPCVFDVKLEERQISMSRDPSDAGAGG